MDMPHAIYQANDEKATSLFVIHRDEQSARRPGQAARQARRRERQLEYGHRLSHKGEQAIDMLKIHGAEVVIKAAGYKPLDPANL